MHVCVCVCLRCFACFKDVKSTDTDEIRFVFISFRCVALTNKCVSFTNVLFILFFFSIQGRRIGRGVGSSKGKTSGRGHKGQKARSGGNIHPMFEGGQTKLYKRIPKRGFTNNQHATRMFPLNIQTLQDYIDTGRLIVNNEDDSKDNTDQVKTLTLKDLVDAGVTKRSALKHGIKLLGKGKLRTPVHLEVSRASQSAIAAVEEAGGTIATVHYNKLALRALLQPEKFGHYLPKQAKPPPKLLPYYTNWKNRGYLSPQAQMLKLLRNRPELKEKLDSGNK